jgi:hypothetical protein
VIELKKLESSDWRVIIDSLYEPVKKEMHGQHGFVRQMKEKDEPLRKKSIQDHVNDFSKLTSNSGLDRQIDALADKMLTINHNASANLYYNYLEILESETDLVRFPTLKVIQDFILKPTSSKISINRLNGLLGRIINESLSQANKTNAGEAGENIVRAILGGAGLKKDVHFREQYKSSKGSDTDFVFPCVQDGQDGKVEAYLAVQMSSNDRTRLATSELKEGAMRFVFTGNGLKASKKKLKDIGTQIIMDQQSRNVRIVCVESGLHFEKQRLSKLIAKGRPDSENVKRLKYFEDYGYGIEKFANYLSSRFSTKT